MGTRLEQVRAYVHATGNRIGALPCHQDEPGYSSTVQQLLLHLAFDEIAKVAANILGFLSLLRGPINGVEKNQIFRRSIAAGRIEADADNEACLRASSLRGVATKNQFLRPLRSVLLILVAARARPHQQYIEDIRILGWKNGPDPATARSLGAILDRL